jgi:hypothetical protein
MNLRPAPCVPMKGSTGHGQSGNSGGQGRRYDVRLDPARSNADIWFETAPHVGQE